MLLTAQMLITLLLTLYITRVMLNILGVQDYGVYNVVCGFVSMFTFLNTSMSNGIQRFFNFELGKNGIESANRVYNSAVITQIMLLSIIVILAETFGVWYMCNKIVIPIDRVVAAHWIYQFSILSFAFIVLQAPYLAAIMAHEKMGYYAAVNLIDVILKLIIALSLPFFGGDRLVLYGILLALISILNYFLYYGYCKKHFQEINLTFLLDYTLFKSMLGFSGWNLFGSFSNMMKEQGINLILNLFFGPIVNAARGVAVQVNGGLQSFVSNLSVSIRPQMVQSYAKGDIELSLNLMFTISKLSCYCLYFVSLPILIDIDYILKIWLRDNVPEHTSTFVIIIAMTSFLNNLNAAVSNLVHATGKMRNYQLFGGICILLSIPATYIALNFGLEPEWALIMAFLSMVLTQIMSLFILRNIIYFSIKKYIQDVIVPFLLVVAISCWIPYIVHSIFAEGFLRLLITGFTSVVCATISIYHVGLKPEERKVLSNIIKRRIY